ncbi:hypothetical protein ACLFKT_07720, partial [Paraburkholderia sp. BR14261]
GRAKGARQRERIRCARIVAEGIRLGCVKQAGVFAFDTNLSAGAAVAALNAASDDARSSAPAPTPTPRSNRADLYDRMARQSQPNPGASGGESAAASPAKSLADRIVAAGQRVAR